MRSRISSWPRYLLLDNTRSLRFDRGKGRAISMGLLFGNSDVMFRFFFFFFFDPDRLISIVEGNTEARWVVCACNWILEFEGGCTIISQMFAFILRTHNPPVKFAEIRSSGKYWELVMESKDVRSNCNVESFCGKSLIQFVHTSFLQTVIDVWKIPMPL